LTKPTSIKALLQVHSGCDILDCKMDNLSFCF